MSASTLWLILSACFCIAILVTWRLMPEEMLDERRLKALGFCFCGGCAAYLSAAAARNGLTGVGLAAVGLIATFLLVAFVSFLTPKSLNGTPVVFGLILLFLGVVLYSLYLVAVLCLMGLGLRGGDPFLSWCDLLMCIGVFEGLGSLLVLAYSWP